MSYKNFNKMLDNLYNLLGDYSQESTKFYLDEPQCNKKPTRLDWINVNNFLKKINRSSNHFLNYIINVRKILATYNGTVMIIQGKYNKNDITKIMLEYISNYCSCSICNSYDTILIKDFTIRKEKLFCNKCKSVNYC